MGGSSGQSRSPEFRTRPVQGDTVVLNVDLGLQASLQSALQNDVLALRKSTDPRSKRTPPALNGAAVVMDPRNGQVLAMASELGLGGRLVILLQLAARWHLTRIREVDLRPQLVG